MGSGVYGLGVGARVNQAVLRVPYTEGRGVRLCWALSKPQGPKGVTPHRVHQMEWLEYGLEGREMRVLWVLRRFGCVFVSSSPLSRYRQAPSIIDSEPCLDALRLLSDVTSSITSVFLSRTLTATTSQCQVSITQAHPPSPRLFYSLERYPPRVTAVRIPIKGPSAAVSVHDEIDRVHNTLEL